MQRSRIVGLGGWTELPVLLGSLEKVEEIEVSAIGRVGCEGGSSGCGIKRW
jgi:2-phospho-L-lactate transferase/gluconeogenesis factor (CofD/UPF0052 family)